MVENKKTRIAHIFNHSYFLGGGEISFFELIRKLDKGLFKPIVIVPAAGEIERKLQCNNIEVHLLMAQGYACMVQSQVESLKHPLFGT
jgi:hypothetical protein